MFFRPKPKAEALQFGLLTFPPCCQQRGGLPADPPADIDPKLRAACWRPDADGEPVCVADPKVSLELAAALAEGAEFDALEVVRVPADRARKAPERLIVFGGFTRGAAYTLAGVTGCVPCLVYDGTLQDAIFYSLSENYKNAQARGHGSARRAVETLLATPLLMERVRDQARRADTTLTRAIAAACQCGASTVDDVLRDRCEGVSGLKIVPRQTKRSNEGATQSGTGLAQATVQVSQPAPDEPPAPTSAPTEPAEQPEPEGEQNVGGAPEVPTVAPLTPTNPGPDLIAGGLIADAKDRIAIGRAQLDAIIRHAKELDEMVRTARGTCAGPLLDRITFNGQPFLIRRGVRERKGTGTVERSEVCCSAAPAVVAATLRRVRPKAVCAGCRGAGCVACKGLGFVPDDEELIRGEGALPFDFPDPWLCEGTV